MSDLVKPNNESLAKALASTAVIIPARNEQSSIGHVLADLPTVGCVIVVDNGSTDQTAFVARQWSCRIVFEPIAGYGRACLAGIDELTRVVQANESPIRYVAFLDADYSDHPDELAGMLAKLIRHDADLVIGSRSQGERERGAMPPQAIFGNWLACTLMRWIWGARFTDLGPFRVIRYESLMRLAMQDLNFGWTIEMQIKATLAGYRVVEIPVRYRRRIGTSKISGTILGTVQAGAKILWTIARYALANPPWSNPNHARSVGHRPT